MSAAVLNLILSSDIDVSESASELGNAMNKPIEFMVTLDDDSWNGVMAGWNCDALRIPEAKAVALYHGGRETDKRDFSQKDTMVLWSSGIARPAVAAARIQIASDLTSADAAARAAEGQKLLLEKEKLVAENRWKRYTLLAGVFTAVLSAVTTYFVSRSPGLPASCKESLVRLRAVAGLQGQTLDKVQGAIEIHAATCGVGH